MTRVAQRPHHARHVGGPAGHLAGSGVERNPHLGVLAVAADDDRVAVVGHVGHHGVVGQGDGQREPEVVVGVFTDQVDPARRRVPDRPSDHHSARSRSATLSGVTSMMKASIADSEPARYFSLVALRRVEISST